MLMIKILARPHGSIVNSNCFFFNFVGADLLRLTKQDMIQILGPADGIRLHNSLQAR